MRVVPSALVATASLAALAAASPALLPFAGGHQQQVVLQHQPISPQPPASNDARPSHYVQLQDGAQTFEGASVLRVEVDETSAGPLIGFAAANNLDVWSSSMSHIDLFLPSANSSSPANPDPRRPSSYESELQAAGYRFAHLTQDVQSLVSASTASSEPYISSLASTAPPPEGRGEIPLADAFHDGYRSLAEQHAFLHDLARVYPWLATVVDLGLTPEGRPLLAIRIGEPPADEHARKKEVVVLSGQHAREWIGPSTALYFAHWLLVNAKARDVRPLLKNLDVTIVPQLNGDGYEYSRTASRLWRKTRQIIEPDSGCVGIDTNRNWGFEWSPGLAARGGGMASKESDPCAEDFPGQHAFQAKEVELVSEYIKSQKVLGFVDLHSYGQMTMYPWAFSCEMIPDAEDLEEVLLGATKALKKSGGREYKSGQACKLAFRAPGDVIDWTYGHADIKWSFSWELPDTGTWGFLLPPAQIRPVAAETVEGLLYLSHFVLQKEGGLRRI